MRKIDQLLAKSSPNGKTTLITHLSDVAQLCRAIATHNNIDPTIAHKGAILHDIGKVSPLFQQTLHADYHKPPGFLFRHEIASLFFLSLLEQEEQGPVIDMVVAHHHSTYTGEEGAKGILDLREQDSTFIDKHLEGFEEWSKDALAILHQFGFPVKEISREEARKNILKTIKYCEKKIRGYSAWKGILIASDQLASAIEEAGIPTIPSLFTKPGLHPYHTRKSPLYPLSLIETDDSRPHTIVTAYTGSGKTIFLMCRCRGRVFYTLPFQASGNAMYQRIRKDLEKTTTDIRLLHAFSRIMETGEEVVLQKHMGASVKILTPYQIAILAFGIKGYEALLTDIKGCDIILDEIHTYSGAMQAIIIKLTEILVHIGCRIHIGTATMPTALHNILLEKLGGKEQVYEVKLPTETLNTLNRHMLYKAESFRSLHHKIEEAITTKQKILIICNQIQKAKSSYKKLAEKYPSVKKMLLHSRFKREDRAALEEKLMTDFQHSTEACIVVATQIVEVSLDISFDFMITDCAPIDALIQRFGRIHRFRHESQPGTYKPIYVLKPSGTDDKFKPYNPGIVKKSYQILPDGEILQERNIQCMVDSVYPTCYPTELNLDSAFKNNQWRLKELQNKKKSQLLEILDIHSTCCITEDDIETYQKGNYDKRTQLEIPVSCKHRTIKNAPRLPYGSHPYVIPTTAYDKTLGL